ncbi:hypothetical protein Lal_00014290 [Lupinus albus]|nr:hypothetical protein Lal_00014290 [Lupinus albus]
MNTDVHSVTPIPVTPVAEILAQAAELYAERPALMFLGERTTYGQLAALVDRAARGLQLLGVTKGTRVGLCLPNTPFSVICYYAALKVGGIVVNFNPLYVARELKHQIEDSGTTVMVTLDAGDLRAKLAGMLDVTCLRTVVLCPMASAGASAGVPSGDERIIPFERLVGNDGRPEPVEIDPMLDPAVLQYTGGTTGVPKGATLTHANLVANAEQVRRRVGALVPGEEKVLGVLPLSHVFAMTVVMNLGVGIGAELILVPRFDLEEVLTLIADTRPTLFPGVPTIYTAINAAIDSAAAKRCVDLSSIRYCISGGAPLPQEIRSRFEELSGCRLVEGYGLSEAAPVVTCNPFTGEPRIGSIGQAVADTIVEVRDPSDPDRVLPIGEHGEICVRGPQVMAGYWQRPDETAEVLKDGMLHTGDIGYCDADGFYFLVDRIKDIIICGGYNVYPRVIEEALYQHPAVAEAVVIGVPDAYRGQAPKAFVCLKEGADADPESIRKFLETQISKIEMPREFEIRRELPKTAVGKLSKLELAAEEKARRSQGAAS